MYVVLNFPHLSGYLAPDMTLLLNMFGALPRKDPKYLHIQQRVWLCVFVCVYGVVCVSREFGVNIGQLPPRTPTHKFLFLLQFTCFA